MAEIKSTLDMAMERAARMAADAPDLSTAQTIRENGMRLAVNYLNGDQPSLLTLLQQQPPEDQMEMRSGMATVLLRNLILPRDQDVSEETLRSFKGIQELSGNAADIAAICSELKKILEQYGKHKDQIKQQFDESILNQLKMQLQQQGVAVNESMALTPTMHPHYKDEWARVSSDLNDQYHHALDQRKTLIARRFNL